MAGGFRTHLSGLAQAPLPAGPGRAGVLGGYLPAESAGLG